LLNGSVPLALAVAAWLAGMAVSHAAGVLGRPAGQQDKERARRQRVEVVSVSRTGFERFLHVCWLSGFGPVKDLTPVGDLPSIERADLRGLPSSLDLEPLRPILRRGGELRLGVWMSKE
jgi:hypothetical protein